MNTKFKKTLNNLKHYGLIGIVFPLLALIIGIALMPLVPIVLFFIILFFYFGPRMT